ncbi:MAG TPA: hypothetical protein VN257_02465, partial [Actinotalea sp.]|nr:hypothetical protein [Actinotalea sp.]
ERPATFSYRDVDGADRELVLPAGSLAFTFCQVPVVYHRGDGPAITVELADGTQVNHPDASLDADASAAIFRRTGAVRALSVTLAGGTPARR